VQTPEETPRCSAITPTTPEKPREVTFSYVVLAGAKSHPFPGIILAKPSLLLCLELVELFCEHDKPDQATNHPAHDEQNYDHIDGLDVVQSLPVQARRPPPTLPI
jgi:hypothetical protein